MVATSSIGRAGASAVTTALVLLLATQPPAVVQAIEEPDCSITTNVRWSSSSDRLYLEGGGCITPSEIILARSDSNGRNNKGPLYHFDRDANEFSDEWTGDFFLDSSLYIEDNTLLNIIGDEYDGNVNRFFLRSDSDKFINLRAHGGQLMIKGVKIRSFDRTRNSGRGGAHRDYSVGRSYISAISEIVLDESETCDGRAKNTMGESRMDIIDSEIRQLGYAAAESYGISYKVRGLCTDLSNLEIMDEVGVYGDILNSELAYNYFGHYSYGHQGGDWSYNKIHHNVVYGFDPHDDSDHLTISNNKVYRNGDHGIIASKRCNNVVIQNNEVYRNGNAGIMLHRSSDHGIVSGNEVYRNGDAGLALFASSHAQVYNNYFYRNKYGVRWSVGASNNEVYDNVVDVTDAEDPLYAIYMFKGNDDPEAGSDGRPKDNVVRDNTLTSPDQIIYLKNSDNNIITDNDMYGSSARFYAAFNNLLVENTINSELELELTLEEDSCFGAGSQDEFEPICDDDDAK